MHFLIFYILLGCGDTDYSHGLFYSLPDNNDIDSSIFKACEYNKLNMIKKFKVVERVENMEKGENTG